MTDLPEINYQTVSQKLNAKLTDLTFQNVQLEVLAEALKAERDQARKELDDLKTTQSDLTEA